MKGHIDGGPLEEENVLGGVCKVCFVVIVWKVELGLPYHVWFFIELYSWTWFRFTIPANKWTSFSNIIAIFMKTIDFQSLIGVYVQKRVVENNSLFKQKTKI